MKILARLEKNINFWFLTSASFIFFLLRLPSLFEPNWYGDEGIYQVLGLGINAGKLLYRDVFDNKPPLLYLLYSIVNSDQFAIRLLSLIFGLISVWAIYYLANKILISKKAALLTVSIYTLFLGLPLIEGNIANAENFMLPLSIISAILIFRSSLEERKKKHLLIIFLSGLILGISFLFKIVAIFDFAAFFIFLFLINIPSDIKTFFTKKNIINLIEKLGVFTASFIAPIILTTIFFVAIGTFSYFSKAVFFNNIDYVRWGNTFIIPQGLLLLKLLLLCIFTLFIFWKRNLFEKGFILSCLWIGFSLFNALFSQRPYTHYVLVLLPSFTLMLGFLFTNNKLSKTAGVITLSCLIVILLNFKFYTKIVHYYHNFIMLVSNNRSVNDYRNFFDHNTPRDYQIADYIILHKKTHNYKTFVWGNNAQLYTLTGDLPPGRYAVAYHITNYKDGLENTKNALETNPPEYIVIMPNVPDYPFSLFSYSLKINLNGVRIYEKFNK